MLPSQKKASITVALIAGIIFLFSAARAGDKYLDAAVDFADCMIEHGRDRYGEVHSPLFAVLLIRFETPHIGPQPLFDPEVKYEWQKKLDNPFKRFNYNRCLNYPEGLGPEGPHKITLTGCDPYEDRALYEFLFDLSRITGNSKYKVEAEKALRWWFANTQSENGLYPWGEQLGWDFEYDCPTYFRGPSAHLYAACYHEVKDDIPFLDILASMPVGGDGGLAHLERYALGIWNAHYWDKERCIYCRHGDYTGIDDRGGSVDGFPAHYGAYLRVWVQTLLVSGNSDIKQQMQVIILRTLDAQLARAEKYGFIPMTFKPDLQGAEAKSNDQSLRLSDIACQLSFVCKADYPEISRRLNALGVKLMPAGGEGPRKPRLPAPDLLHERDARKHAREIIRYVEWYTKHGKDPEYLKAAERLADTAFAMFCDEKSPLPRAYAGPVRATPSGETFADFYFRGAELMHAFALLGEAGEKKGIKARVFSAAR